MHQYKNQDYYPRVHDFGDGYHLPDEENVILGKDFLTEVKRLKRRYRSYEDFCAAMEIYQEYSQYLIDKYGGKKKFKLAYATGQVKELVPFKPELRETKVNKKYIHDGAVPVYENENTDEYTQNSFEVDCHDLEDIDISFKIKAKLDYDVEHSLGPSNYDIVRELDIIDQFFAYGGKNGPRKLSKKTKRDQKREMIRRQYEEYISMSERLNEHEKAKFVIDDTVYDPDKVISYKGSLITMEQADELELDDQLRKYGIYLNKRYFSKASRKVIRRKEKANKKSKKKKNLEKFMDNFTDGYSEFQEFERQMSQLVGSGLPRR